MLRLITSSSGRTLACIRHPHERQPYSTEALATGYKPFEVERRRSEHVFQTPAAQRTYPKYSFILPPPNVTGHLHLGHALMCTVQDVIARQRRRKQYDVCWIPGTDHAGIATQVIVEKHLRKQHGHGRHALGRERFLEEVWRWRDSKAESIRTDLQRIGCTADWSREFFTMDDRQSRAVRAAFVRLFDEGLLYRDGQLVNWSCALESTISDIEVNMVPVQGPTRISVPGYDRPVVFGELTEFAYIVCCDDGGSEPTGNSHKEIIVATTRPETMLGDVAVAVHPDDVRYSHLRGSATNGKPMLWHALRGEPIPLVFDAAVDREFGTGAVKITPAHDRFDFDLARRHDLPTTLAVIDERGAICGSNGDTTWNGLPRFVARERIRSRLADLGHLRAIRPHSMQLPVCSRSGDVVELLLRPQWFLRCAEMAAEAQRAVETGALRLQPEQFATEWHRWLAASRDWCVSRQLWWGHRIPAYECHRIGADGTVQSDGRVVWVAAGDEVEARRKAAKEFGVPNEVSSTQILVEQDPDVLDTWFSSALLPFSAVGWPDVKNVDFQRYYPHDVLITGHDILFFWVARMVMLGQRLTGSLPFGTVLLHGIVCDAQGRKMSKSLGNVVTPMQVIAGAPLAALHADTDAALAAGTLSPEECDRSKKDQTKLFPNGIPECGTDALRFTLCSHNIKAHFIAFDAQECYTNKLFFNKIWQATRFTITAREKWLNGGNDDVPNVSDMQLTVMDRWILSRLARTILTIDGAMETFQLHVATTALKTFMYQNLCDVYLETTKTGLTSNNKQKARNHCSVLSECLRRGLDELEPFAPFVSQELRRHVHVGGNDKQTTSFVPAEWISDALEYEVEEMLSICAAIRQLKSERGITRKHQPKVYIHISDAALLQRLQLHHCDDIRVLSLCTAVQLNKESANRKYIAQSTAGPNCSFGIEINPESAKHLLRNSYAESLEHSRGSSSVVNERKLHKLAQELERLERIVANEGFRRSASAKVQQQHSEKIDRIRLELGSIRQMSAAD